MNEEKRKQKALAKQIKKINNSLTYLPKSYQANLDVLAIQKEEHVYFAGNGLYKKIYMFKPATLGNKRVAFIKALTDRFNNRIRFTMCANNKNEKVSAYMFMTVDFKADSYYEVRKDIQAFEEDLMNRICVFLGITISACTIENALTYIYMNFTGEMKKIDINAFLGKNFSFDKKSLIDACENGRFLSGEKKGCVYLGKDYPDSTDGVTQFIKLHNGTFYIVVDLQKYDDDDLHVFDYELKNRYSLVSDREYEKKINMTYVFSWVKGKDELTESKNDEVMTFYDNLGIQLMPAVGREERAFFSSCFLGLRDFRSMQNASPDMIGGLLF